MELGNGNGRRDDEGLGKEEREWDDRLEEELGQGVEGAAIGR